MSRNYDNWERLVAAVLRREQLWQLAMSSSFSSVSSDSNFSLSGRISSDFSSNHQTEQIPPISFVNHRLDPLQLPPKNPYLSGGGVVAGAALVFSAPTNMLAWYQLRKLQQKNFVSGVPKLMRSELETACEDFSNVVIGSSSSCILYKGTLHSGVEVAVTYMPMASAKHWLYDLEARFREKIKTLSKVNHKNFINLFGYCMEEKPFTRMMVFEYAPNGTLFEYLHIKESERLDWKPRLRIVMGIAYCLEHMHQLTPAFVHGNLTSSAVYLTEDYAAKLSDFFYWDEVATAETEQNLQGNVYSFGIILFEMMTGYIPYSVNWLSVYPRVQSLREMVDPALKIYQEDLLEQIGGVIKSCANPDPRQRLSMRKVCAWLREITQITPDLAIPRVLPL